jgi:hypothetical protein
MKPTYSLMGRWPMSEDEEQEVDEDASSTMSEDDVDPPDADLESSREDADDLILSSLS